MTTSSLNHLKNACRKDLRSRVRILSGDSLLVRQRAELLKLAVLSHSAVQRAASIGFFITMKGKEIEMEPLIKALLVERESRGLRLFVPRVVSRGQSAEGTRKLQLIMKMIEVCSWEEILSQPAPMNQSGEDEEQKAEPDVREAPHLDVVLVPGLGFDQIGPYRLGRGGGFYDEWLWNCQNQRKTLGLPPPVFLGVGYREQLLPSIPIEDHDVPMSELILA